jgi:hypothetical protein
MVPTSLTQATPMHGRRKPKVFTRRNVTASTIRVGDRLQPIETAAHGLGAPGGGLIKHALIQDVAYASLLKSRRNELHGRIAAVLEARFAHQCDADID